MNRIKKLFIILFTISLAFKVVAKDAPASFADLAEKSGHHCTKTFVDELQKLRRPVRWIVVHRKPRYAEQIASELAAHNISGVELIQPGKVYEFSA